MADSDQSFNRNPERTAREALIAELLGDAGELLTRAEALLNRSDQAAVALTASVEQAAAALSQASERAGLEVAESARLAQANTSAEANETLAAARALTQEVNATAAAIQGECRRLFWRTLALGGVGGLIASLLIGAGILLATQ